MKTPIVLLLVLALLFIPGTATSSLVEARSAPADEVIITLGSYGSLIYSEGLSAPVARCSMTYAIPPDAARPRSGQ